MTDGFDKPSRNEDEYFAKQELERRKKWAAEQSAKMATDEKEKLKQALALGGGPNSWQRFMQRSEALRLAKEAAAMDAGSSRVVTFDEELDDDDAEDPPDQDR